MFASLGLRLCSRSRRIASIYASLIESRLPPSPPIPPIDDAAHVTKYNINILTSDHAPTKWERKLSLVLNHNVIIILFIYTTYRPVEKRKSYLLEYYVLKALVLN